jgi:hypothetical protein
MQPSDASRPMYLVFDIETIPDGVLLQRTKYPGENLTPDEAVLRAQDETRAASTTGSDFLSTSVQLPIALCVARIGADYSLQTLRCLDCPQFRPKELVKQFWEGLAKYKFKLISFNGRGFDIPVLELAAFRYGIPVPHHFAAKYSSRYRYGEDHIDLLDFLTNYGAIRLTGGLNLLAKILGKPGKMETKGSDVYSLYREGKIQEINDYCCYDVLDTYFVFLRTRVLMGELTAEQEQQIAGEAKKWIAHRSLEQPHLKKYLEHWTDDNPWP